MICPLCHSKGAYVGGITEVHCPNEGCEAFKSFESDQMCATAYCYKNFCVTVYYNQGESQVCLRCAKNLIVSL